MQTPQQYNLGVGDDVEPVRDLPLVPQQPQPQAPTNYSPGYSNPPMYYNPQPTRPPSGDGTQQQIQQQQSKSKERKHHLKIVDPNTGKDISGEIYHKENPAAPGEPWAYGTPVSCEAMGAGHGNREIAAQFAAQVAKVAGNQPDSGNMNSVSAHQQPPHATQSPQQPGMPSQMPSSSHMNQSLPMTVPPQMMDGYGGIVMETDAQNLPPNVLLTQPMGSPSVPIPINPNMHAHLDMGVPLTSPNTDALNMMPVLDVGTMGLVVESIEQSSGDSVDAGQYSHVLDASKKERAKKKANDYDKMDHKGTDMDAFTDTKISQRMQTHQQYNPASGMTLSQSGIYQVPQQPQPQTPTNYSPGYSPGYGNPPMFYNPQPNRPPSGGGTQQQIQQQSKSKERKQQLKIVDPNTGKDISGEVYHTENPAAPGEPGARGTSVSSEAMGAGHGNREIAAQFAAQVAKAAGNQPDSGNMNSVSPHQQPPHATPSPQQPGMPPHVVSKDVKPVTSVSVSTDSKPVTSPSVVSWDSKPVTSPNVLAKDVKPIASPVVTQESKPATPPTAPAKDVWPVTNVSHREPVTVSVESIVAPIRTSDSSGSVSSVGKDNESPVRDVTPEVIIVPPTSVKREASPPIEKAVPVPVPQPPVVEPVKEVKVLDSPKKERAKKKAKDYDKMDLKGTDMDAFTDTKISQRMQTHQQYNPASGMTSSHSGIYQLPQQPQPQAPTNYSPGYGNPPMFYNPQPNRPPSRGGTQQQIQQQSKSKERKQQLKIVDPNTGKDISGEVYHTENPAAPGEPGARGTSVSSEAMGAGHGNREIAAQFAAQVAKAAGNKPDSGNMNSTSPHQQPPHATPSPQNRGQKQQAMAAGPGNREIAAQFAAQVAQVAKAAGNQPDSGNMNSISPHQQPPHATPSPQNRGQKQQAMGAGHGNREIAAQFAAQVAKAAGYQPDSGNMNSISPHQQPPHATPSPQQPGMPPHVVSKDVKPVTSVSVSTDSKPVTSPSVVSRDSKPVTSPNVLAKDVKPIASPVVTQESKPATPPTAPAKDVRPVTNVSHREPVTVSVESIVAPSRTSDSSGSVSSVSKDTESPVRDVTPEVFIVPPTPVKNEASPPIEKAAPVPVPQPPVVEPIKEVKANAATPMGDNSSRIVPMGDNSRQIVPTGSVVLPGVSDQMERSPSAGTLSVPSENEATSDETSANAATPMGDNSSRIVPMGDNSRQIVPTGSAVLPGVSDQMERSPSAGTLSVPSENEATSDETSGYRRVNRGKIFYNSNIKLGKGPNSVVYRGRFENRDVAVKCIDCSSMSSNKAAGQTMDDIRKVYREIDIMNKLDQTGHEHIIRYYVSEIEKTNVYLVLELCDGTLNKYVNTPEWKQKLSPTAVTLHMARGLHYLSSRNFAHRDLRPENVLIRSIDMPSRKAVIADFGQSKVTVGDLYSFTGAFGAAGYIAPEAYDAILQSSPDEPVATHISSHADMFSLGCLFYFTLTGGAHPFGGNNLVAQNNILCRNSPVFDKLPKCQYAMEQLIALMIQMKPEDRPSPTQILKHPALWPSDKIIKYFCDASDCLDEGTLQAGYVPDPPNNNWLQNLPNGTRHYLETYNNGRVYGGRGKNAASHPKAAYHLKAIRNLETHFKDKTFPEYVQNEMGDSNDDHVQFWLTANPTFLMHVYSKMSTCPEHI